jgi:prepilin-type N-terminal cleavage/methylation domain-containing protein/prepilin-type processing-associated H-X9-DG protein
MREHTRNRNRGFTVIELLVVVSLIALLIAILLPSLSSARKHTQALVCSTNLNHVGKALANYLFANKSIYPASYLYPDDPDGNWTMQTQDEKHPYGYVHWSSFLYEDGAMEGKGFQCPVMERGGAPRTNPGLREVDWQLGEQVDQNGDEKPNELTDKQAPRMAYTANATIMPRNKFTTELSGGDRINRFVAEQKIKDTGKTILATEFLNNWRAIGIRKGDKILVKSHRPVNPYFHVGSGFNEYAASRMTPGFIYGLPSDQETYGLLDTTDVKDKVNILDHTSGIAQINAVGRHHPGGDKRLRKRFDGTANFLFCDGHAEPLMVLETMQKRMWGDQYYSVNGENEVMNMRIVDTGK